jgi:hypothetical protein
MSCVRRFVQVVAILALFVARLAAAEFPAGWTGLFDVTGRCFYAVPPRWKIDDSLKMSGPIAASPDGRVTATIFWSEQHSWSWFTARLRGALRPIVVLEDSANRFWVEYRDSRLAIYQLSAVPNPGGSCMFEVTASEPVADETRRILSAVVDTVTSIR